MHDSEIAGLVSALAPVVADFTTKAMAPLRAENKALLSRLDAMEQRFASLPTKEENSVLILRLVDDAASKIQVPQVDPAQVEAVIVEKLAEAVAAIPPALPGKDADPAEVAKLLVDLMPVPAPGKDADPETISRMVCEEVAKLPPAIPGKDADPTLVAELVDKAVAALDIKGEAGTSVTLDDVAPMIDEVVARHVAALPPAEPGKSVTVADLAPVVAEEVERAVSGIELPRVDWSEVEKMIGDKVSDAVGSIPPGLPGKDADPSLIKDMVDKAIADLPPAKDGAAGKDVDPEEVRAAIDRAVSAAVDKIPVPKDGRDGRDASDLQVIARMISEQLSEQFGALVSSVKVGTPDDGRTFVFEGSVGQNSFREEVKTALPLDRGVWREGAFEKGDCVSYGGQISIARRNTEPTEKPMDGSPAWRLAIKKGKDGKDGIQGKQGERGPKGESPAPFRVA